jgi:hypothetical protein
MVAPLVGAAAISGVGSLIGGVTGGKGAKKAAEVQQQTARDQIAAIQQNQKFLYGLSAPTIERGNAAGDTYAGLLGVGGDAAKSANAINTWRNSFGYQDLLREGLGAVNANAYARGMGNSGATLKALQDRGSQIANQSGQQYLGNLGNLIGWGNQAVGTVGGVSQNATNAINQVSQNSADAQSNAALAGAQGLSNALQGIFNAGSYALGSSYGGGNSGGFGQPMMQTPYGNMYGGLNPRWG